MKGVGADFFVGRGLQNHEDLVRVFVCRVGFCALPPPCGAHSQKSLQLTAEGFFVLCDPYFLPTTTPLSTV